MGFGEMGVLLISETIISTQTVTLDWASAWLRRGSLGHSGVRQLGFFLSATKVGLHAILP